METYLIRIKNFTSNLSEEAFSAIKAAFVRKSYSKGAYLLKPGQICDGHFIIDKGIARKYYLHGDKEITSNIYFEGSVAISLDSYILQKKSTVFIEALTDLEVTKVNYLQFQITKQKYPEIEILDRLFIELHAVWFENQLREAQTLSATERYLKLLEINPRVIQFIPLTIVASYLNISLATLSRIRAKIIRHGYLT